MKVMIGADCMRLNKQSSTPRTYFGKPIGVRSQDGHVARLGIGIVEGNVLFHGQFQRFFLLIGCGPRVFADMLRINDMFDDAKWRRHC